MGCGKLLNFTGVLIICIISEAVCRQLSDAELHRLPKLFHLDNYERCLSQDHGVYCLGTFELSAQPSHPVFELMKEHTQCPLKFNRTLLHRGYCVSERCPAKTDYRKRKKHCELERKFNSSIQNCRHFEQNTLDSEQIHDLERKSYELERKSYAVEGNSIRFEQCVSKYARRHSFTARLSTLQYCTTHQGYQRKLNRSLSDDQWMYLYAVGFILLLNIVGTLYDWSGRNGSSLLKAWSINASWCRFTQVDDSALMKSLAPLQMSRLTLQWIVIYAHNILTHMLVYVSNPEEIERNIHGIVGSLIRNGTSLVQVFILISCFLTGFNFLLFINKYKEVNVKIMMKWTLKRLFRIVPVYLLVLGYATTWWGRGANGPLWGAVRAESALCRRKFWLQMLFINNLVQPGDLCLLQSWGLAIDMQLYIISLLIIYLLMKTRANGARVLASLFVLSGLFNVLLAYTSGWEPMVRLLYPENVRVLFKKTPTLPQIHMSIWGNLPACFLGLFIAYFYFEIWRNKPDSYKNGEIILTRSNNVVQSNGSVQNDVKRNGYVQNGSGLIHSEVVNNGLGENTTKTRMVDNELDINGFVYNKVVLFEKLNAEGTFYNGHDGNVQDNMEYYGLSQDKVETNGYIQHEVKRMEIKDKTKTNSINDDSITKVNKRLGKEVKIKSGNGSNNNGPDGNGYMSDELTQNGFISKDNKKKVIGLRQIVFYLLRKADIFALPCLTIWTYLGTHIESFESKAVIALYVGMERIVFSVLFAMLLFSVFNYDGWLRRVATWRGWQAAGRLVYCLTVLHWCVALSLAASRPQPVHATLFSASMDWLATMFYSYLLALPVCLLVELPAQKFFDILLNKLL